MKKLFLISTVIIILSGATLAFASYSFGSITGYAIVEQAIKLDIMGSSNDISYNLSTVRQGETRYSPEIKIVNNGDANVSVDIILNSTANISMSVWDQNKTQQLNNPVVIPASDMYVLIRHDFPAGIQPGECNFSMSVFASE